MTLRLRKTVLWSCSGIALILVSLFTISVVRGDPRLHSKARKQWKERALKSISSRSSAPLAITSEVAALRMVAPQMEEGWWVGTNVLVMTNGEYLVYSQVCSKQNAKVHDIFIAQGSDGKWYYSTYHFCIGMMTMRIEDAPGSIHEFTNNYFARAFDGRSDECLQKTWPVKRSSNSNVR